MGNVSVSIIIVSYNCPSLLRDLLNSIKANTVGLSYEIIIIDNNSSTSNAEVLALFNNIQYVQLPENVGFGKANNIGLEMAKGKYILFLNPDTVLLNNAIALMANFLMTNPEIGACGGNLYDIQMKPTRSFKRCFPSNSWLWGNILLGNKYESILYGKSKIFNYGNLPIPVAYIVGADLMVRTSILKKIGGFNPLFFMYYEEVELCWRIHKAGYKIYSLPSAHIQHLEGKTSSNPEKRAKMMFDSSIIYYNLTLGKISNGIARLLIFLMGIERLIIYNFSCKKDNVLFWKIQLRCLLNNTISR